MRSEAQLEMRGAGSPAPRSRWRRFFSRAGWFAPAALAVLVPKCPLCLAGYLAAAAGLGFAGKEMCGAPAPCLPAWVAPAALAVALAFVMFGMWRMRRHPH